MESGICEDMDWGAWSNEVMRAWRKEAFHPLPKRRGNRGPCPLWTRINGIPSYPAPTASTVEPATTLAIASVFLFRPSRHHILWGQLDQKPIRNTRSFTSSRGIIPLHASPTPCIHTHLYRNLYSFHKPSSSPAKVTEILSISRWGWYSGSPLETFGWLWW